MKEGDICVIVLGVVYPIILRKCDVCFQLVGPALLHGFMNGEAENLCGNGTILVQGFEII
jgi:hypothetical protein